MELLLDVRSGINAEATAASLFACGADRAAVIGRLREFGACTPDVQSAAGGEASVRLLSGSENGTEPAGILRTVEKIVAGIRLPENMSRRMAAVLGRLGETDACSAALGAAGIAVCAACLENLEVRAVHATPLPVCAVPCEALHLTDGCTFAPGALNASVSTDGCIVYAALAGSTLDQFTGRLCSLGRGRSPSDEGVQVGACLFERRGVPHSEGGVERICQLETHVDHLTGEEIGLAISALAAMREVLDVLWLTGTGKKGRPMGLLRVMCFIPDEEAVAAELFRHTHTLGYRRLFCERRVLPRSRTVSGSGLEAKAYTIGGSIYVRPECDAVRLAAEEAGLGAPALRIERRTRQ